MSVNLIGQKFADTDVLSGGVELRHVLNYEAKQNMCFFNMEMSYISWINTAISLKPLLTIRCLGKIKLFTVHLFTSL